MFRYAIVLIVSSLILPGCAGGLSGIMHSSYLGDWLIYKVNYPESGMKFDQSSEDILENMLINIGFDKKYDWRRPLLANVRVATFKQEYMNHYIRIDAEISQKSITMMSTSYSNNTKNIFDTLEAALIEVFGETNVEERFCTRDIYSYRCL